MTASTQLQPKAPAEALPRLQRPARDHALQFARTLFVRGERVDMQILCAALGVGRTTLYRWVGDREQLIATVLAQLTEETWTQATHQAGRTGIDRAVDIARRFMQITAEFQPLREFARREPALALRILMSPDGPVGDSIRAGFTRALAANLPHEAITPELVDTAVQLGTALEWAPIIIGEEPAIERAVHLARTLIQTTLNANQPR